MVEKINTGKYQVCRNRIGIANSTEILITGSKEDIEIYWENLHKTDIDHSFNYYKTEEVFYKGTQKDKDGKPIDTIAGYQRM